MAMAASASITVAPAAAAAAAAAASSSSSSSSSSASILSRRFNHSPLHPQTFLLPRSASSSSLLPSLSFSSRRNPNPKFLLCRAQEDEIDASSAAEASADSIVSQVALLEEEPDTPGIAPKTNGSAVAAPTTTKKLSALQRGGTLTGDKAAGLDPSPAALGKSNRISSISGSFSDSRWKNGTWDLKQFASGGKVDWDAVIDAEVIRRKWLEESPEASKNDDPVVFDTSIIPWWAWVKRFHLPEAELLNGRAAMIGYVMGYFVDALTGAGLVDQTSNFFGKLLLLISVLGVLFIRKNEDLETLKQLAKELTFYDKQWQASWQEEKAPGSKSEQ